MLIHPQKVPWAPVVDLLRRREFTSDLEDQRYNSWNEAYFTKLACHRKLRNPAWEVDHTFLARGMSIRQIVAGLSRGVRSLSTTGIRAGASAEGVLFSSPEHTHTTACLSLHTLPNLHPCVERRGEVDEKGWSQLLHQIMIAFFAIRPACSRCLPPLLFRLPTAGRHVKAWTCSANAEGEGGLPWLGPAQRCVST